VGLLNAVAELFPSTLFGGGGDEINMRCCADGAQTQSDLAGRMLDQALDPFTQAARHGALRNLGKAPVGRRVRDTFDLTRPLPLRGI
jgi:hexosaminidase